MDGKRQIKSYIAKVSAKDGFLLGGVKDHVSCRFESYKDAAGWAEIIVATNLKAGRNAVHNGIRGSKLKPEILEVEILDERQESHTGDGKGRKPTVIECFNSNDEFECPYCDVKIGKNLRDQKPYGLAAIHLWDHACNQTDKPLSRTGGKV